MTQTTPFAGATGSPGSLAFSEKAVGHLVRMCLDTIPGHIHHSSGLDRVTGRELPRWEVDIDPEGTAMSVEVHIAALWPAPLTDLAALIRHQVAQWVEQLTRIPVVTVDVTIAAVVPRESEPTSTLAPVSSLAPLPSPNMAAYPPPTGTTTPRATPLVPTISPHARPARPLRPIMTPHAIIPTRDVVARPLTVTHLVGEIRPTLTPVHIRSTQRICPEVAPLEEERQALAAEIAGCTLPAMSGEGVSDDAAGGVSDDATGGVFDDATGGVFDDGAGANGVSDGNGTPAEGSETSAATPAGYTNGDTAKAGAAVPTTPEEA